MLFGSVTGALQSLIIQGCGGDNMRAAIQQNKWVGELDDGNVFDHCFVLDMGATNDYVSYTVGRSLTFSSCGFRNISSGFRAFRDAQFSGLSVLVSCTFDRAPLHSGSYVEESCVTGAAFSKVCVGDFFLGLARLDCKPVSWCVPSPSLVSCPAGVETTVTLQESKCVIED
jgi:hypothetical protein